MAQAGLIFRSLLLFMGGGSLSLRTKAAPHHYVRSKEREQGVHAVVNGK